MITYERHFMCCMAVHFGLIPWENIQQRVGCQLFSEVPRKFLDALYCVW